jgi:membrane protein implicated in regulation of membrane protease activity
MNGRQFSFKPSGNPLVQALSVIVFGVLLVGAIIMGAFVLAALVGVGLIAFAVLAVRVWWFRRKLRNRAPSEASRGPQGERLIEAEYEVLDVERRERDRR